VLEQITAHFFTRAMVLKSKGGKPELIAANLRHAAAIAEKVAPYRHPRMGSMKLVTDPNRKPPLHTLLGHAERLAQRSL
jgi:hypothetical protein